ncbi:MULTISPECIES: hypothetical protein [unclassified Caballeronia]|uniref:hypothetical protein n=1 Tax=unclassified Caballeronia TaxID=2646786 RepID=UPI002029AF87|nr:MULTISPECIES: hypothetical protein [unclassified Caballeronia]
MTGALEIKVTISEVVTPALFDALVAISNPRQRAALLKRLAEDALRGSVSVSHQPGTRDAPAATGQPIAGPTIVTSAGDAVVTAASKTDRDGEPDFDYAFLAENLNFG